MGFRRLPDNPKEMCTHPEHKPPGMIVLRPGTYEYTCPACGNTFTLTVPEVRC